MQEVLDNRIEAAVNEVAALQIAVAEHGQIPAPEIELMAPVQVQQENNLDHQPDPPLGLPQEHYLAVMNNLCPHCGAQVLL